MKKIRVLIIDDSAFARKVIREVLSRDPEIDVVGFARDGLDGLEKIAELRPDVVTLDLIMPNLDGLGVLESLKQGLSPKVVVVSVSGSETEIALEALASGAVELVTKPTAVATERLYELSDDLVRAVKTAAGAKIRKFETKALPLSKLNKSALPGYLVVIGTSTGGPQALTEIFKALHEGFPAPIAVALHIPPGYTASLAARISKLSGVKMSEATDGAELHAGEAVIAPGGMHLKFRREGNKYFAVLTREPINAVHHPSVDLLFASAAAAAGEKLVGVILTGMGNDGLKGADAIRNAGGKMLAESESSCVVYGMPRCVIEAGLADAEAPLEKIPRLLLETLYTIWP